MSLFSAMPLRATLKIRPFCSFQSIQAIAANVVCSDRLHTYIHAAGMLAEGMDCCGASTSEVVNAHWINRCAADSVRLRSHRRQISDASQPFLIRLSAVFNLLCIISHLNVFTFGGILAFQMDANIGVGTPGLINILYKELAEY
jgi:hypothetical protein